MKLPALEILCIISLTFCSEILAQRSYLPQNNEVLLARAIQFLTPYTSEIQDWFWRVSGVRNPKEVKGIQSRADYIGCDLCNQGFPALRQLLHANVPKDVIVGVATAVCVALKLAPRPDICEPTIKSYASSIIYMLSNRPDLLVTDLCGIMNPGCGEVSERLTNWKIKINTAKPQFVPRPGLPSNTETVKILQFTDIHLDLDYKEGTNADCGLPICCRDGIPANDSGTAGKYGHYNCALPVTALDALYDHAQKNNQEVEFIFLTGDYVHSGIWLYSQEENSKHIKSVTTKLAAAFPNTVIYPLTGNHEPDVVNMYSPPELWGDFDLSWMYNIVSEPFAKHIPPIELRQFKKYGYYSVTPDKHQNLRIIALNTNLCYVDNFWLAYDPIDTGGQLQWFADTLGNAEKLGQSVLVIGHILPGSGSCWPVWSSQFNRIINRYEHIIRGQFYGHSHTQYYTLALEDETNRAISVSFVGGSGLTDGMNPAYNVYHLDGKRALGTWEILNQETFILNLNESNSNSLGEPVVEQLLDAKKDFALKSMRPDVLYDFANRMICDDKLFVKYLTVSSKGADSPRLKVCTNSTCKAGTLGKMVSFNSANSSPYELMESTIFTKDCRAVTPGPNGTSGLVRVSWFIMLLSVLIMSLNLIHTSCF